jgi:hypothetical protein
MNRAPRTRPEGEEILRDAIKQMTFEDAMGIRGAAISATEYFRS